MKRRPKTLVFNSLVKVKSLSRVQLFVTPWTAAHQAHPSMGFSRQEYWSGVPLPSPLNLILLPKRNLNFNGVKKNNSRNL